MPSAHAMVGRARLETGECRRCQDRGARPAHGVLDRVGPRWLWPVARSPIAPRSSPVLRLLLMPCRSSTSSRPTPVSWLSAGDRRGGSARGAADRYRGMLLGVLGRHDEAIATLVTALALEESVPGPRPSRLTHAHFLARTAPCLGGSGPGDQERAASELDLSIETAERLGVSALGHRRSGPRGRGGASLGWSRQR